MDREDLIGKFKILINHADEMINFEQILVWANCLELNYLRPYYFIACGLITPNRASKNSFFRKNGFNFTFLFKINDWCQWWLAKELDQGWRCKHVLWTAWVLRGA
ncbi:hypothetical protein ACJX0J_020216 [Zea mays]